MIEGDSHIGAWVQQAGRLDHDQNALPLILKHIKVGDVVVDGGAFIGDHTVAYAKAVGESGKVYAFEPNREAFDCLAYNTGKLPQVVARTWGLSDALHDVGFVPNENAGASHFQVTGENDAGMDMLDFLRLDQCNLIKLDIEGFEVRALKGAAKTIKRCRPVLVVEVNEGALNRQGTTGAKLLDLIHEYGYRIENLYPKQPLSGAQFDVIGRPL